MLMLAPGISEQSYDSWGLGVVHSLIVVNMQCAQYFLLYLQKHRVCVWVRQNNPQTPRIITLF